MKRSSVPGPAALTFALVACAYALGLCPSLYWLDSSELAAAGFELGIAHAPGQPLALLVFRLFDYLPLGDVALRAGLSQAICGAGAAAILAWIGAQLARRFTHREHIADLLGVGAGLLYAGSYAAAFQSVRPEVYALSALLVLGTIALCLRFVDDPKPSHLGLAGLLFGLGLTNHHYLTLLGAAPPALALILPSLRRHRAATLRGLRDGAVGTALGLLVYAYLPLRAAHDPVVDWGHPTTLSSFLWVVSARSFQKSVTVDSGDDLPALIGALLDQLTPVSALLALAGLYLALRRVPRLGLALALMLGGPILARLLVSFDAGNPDAYGYLSTGIAALALLTVPLFAVVAEMAPPVGSALTGLALLAVVVRAILVAPSLSLRRFDEARPVFAPVVAQLPSGGLAITSNFQTTFAFDYLRVVEEARPDVRFVARHFIAQPGERAALVAADPTLAPLLSARDVEPDALIASPRPFFLEYDLDLAPRLAPRATTIQVTGGAELQTRRFAVWQDLLAYHRLCVLGAPEKEREAGLARLRSHTATTGEGAALVDELVARCPALGVR